MPIRIEIEANSAEEARAEMRDLLAGTAQTVAARPAPAETEANVAAVMSDMADDTPDEDGIAEPTPAAEAAERELEAKEEPQARLYGQPSPGKARRNKAEMAEDEEIEKLLAETKTKVADDEPAGELLEYLREQNAKLDAETIDPHADANGEEEAPSNISTSPEDRKEPGEDETVGESKTREDMRAAMTAYVEKHGMDKAMTDLPKIMGYEKQSEVPEDPALFAAIVAKIEEAL